MAAIAPIDVVSLPALTSPVTRLTISSLVIWSPMSWVLTRSLIKSSPGSD